MKREFIDRSLAVYHLIGDGFQISNTGTITATNGQKIPTEEEIETKLVELLAEYDALQYQRDRATEYPAIADQLDEIYHNGIDSWKAVIKVTKDKYPKPS